MSRVVHATTCANCGQRLHGRFCHDCGQKAGSTHLSLREVGHELSMRSRTMFLLMPLFGFLTWLFYRRTQPYYVAHLYYSIHFHAFTFLAFAVLVLCSLAWRYGRAAGGLAPFAIFPYHYLSIRRVFDGSRLQTAWKGTIIGMIYFLAIGAVVIVQALLVLKARTGN